MLPPDHYTHKGMRQALVQSLRQQKLFSEAVLTAMLKVPRHFFLDTAFLEHAYQDKPFSIGEGQTISQPTTVAYQTELLAINKGDKVLEIGTGSGYQSAILMELGVKLYTVEYNKNLYQKARRLLTQMGYQANFICGDGSQGWATFAPYDKILVTAGSPKVPQALFEQLKPNGVLVIPVGNSQSQEMHKIHKTIDNQVVVERYGSFSFVPLLGKDGWG